MKLFTCYGTTLRVHPFFPLTLLLLFLGGQGLAATAALLTLILHEAGHYWVASRLRLPVTEIELTPFGGAMQIALSEGLSGRRGLALASAGITVNLVCVLLGSALLLRNFSSFLGWLVSANLAMLAVNLLPALPLDGGRMLLSLLSVRHSRPKVFRALLYAGRGIALGLMLCSLYCAIKGQLRLTPMMIGCYLLYASALEEKNGSARYLSALFSRRYRLDNGSALPVQHLCAAPELPLCTLLPQLQPGAYHRIDVLDSQNGAIYGTVTEEMLFRAVMEEPSATMERILADHNKRPRTPAERADPGSE